MKNFYSGKSIQAILIIPEAGCPGCISNAENFAKANLSNENILFLFTKIYSEKGIRIKLEIERTTQSNIYFDKKNEYSLPPEYEWADFPHIVYLNEAGFTKLVPVLPGTDKPYDSLLSVLKNKDIVTLDPSLVVDNQLANTGIKSIAEDIDYIILQTSEEILISEIVDISITSDRIFITDASENAYVFSRDGTFLGKIGSRGSGPGEYLSLLPGCFIPDTISKELIICDYSGRKTLVFNEAGVLRRTIENGFRANSVTIINDSLYCFIVDPATVRNLEPSSVIITDKNGRVIRNLKSVLSRRNYVSQGRFFHSDSVCYFTICSVSDSVFRLTEDLSFRVAMVVEKGKYRPPPEILNDIGKWASNISDYIFNVSFQVVGRKYFFNFGFKNVYYSGYLKPEFPEPVLVYKGTIREGIRDDIDLGLPLSPAFRISGGYIIDIISMHKFLNYDFPSDCRNPEILAIRKKSKIEDNPLIRLVKLKK